MCSELYEKSPSLGSGVHIAKSAVLLGNVIVGDDVGIWHNAVIRCEHNQISIGRGSNVQDNSVLHVDLTCSLEVGEYVTIGHGAIVHGEKIGNNTLIGMGATILSRAVIGQNCIVGAGALVTEGQVIPDNSLVVGCPAKIVRKTNDEDIKRIKENADVYIEMARKYLP